LTENPSREVVNRKCYFLHIHFQEMLDLELIEEKKRPFGGGNLKNSQFI
jgi:hypothetical protein